jgi:ABC-2 type transport system ATP-binding protein
MVAPALSVEQLSKTYPETELAFLSFVTRKSGVRLALADVSFEIGDGEVVGLIGPNGAGKSTLIRILAGVLLPSSGSARLGSDSLVRDRSQVRQMIGIAINEDRGLSPRLTLEENLRFFGALYGMRLGEVLQRIKELEGPLEVRNLLARRIQTLSSGERARATLLRAYLHRPKLVLLDELTRSLDPGAAPRIGEWIISEAKQRGTAVLFASHDRVEVQSMASRVLLMSEGRALAFGPYRVVEPVATQVFRS